MRPVLHKFYADRGTHLAAMIAYFALLSFVPLLFLALSLVGLVGVQGETSYLIEQLRQAFPATSIDRLLEVVRGLQARAIELGVVGLVGLLWAALGLFSVLESAFNIVYGLPNRPFIRGKLLVLVLVAASIVALFVALIVSSVGAGLAKEAAVVGDAVAHVYALVVSTALIFGFAWTIYTLLTNAPLTWRETIPGALFTAVLLQASFQLLPIFVRATGDLVVLRTFGGLVLLLFWLYVMANILVLGAEVNWWLARGRAGQARAREEEAAGLA